MVGEGEGEGAGDADIDVLDTITSYILSIDCLLIALDAYMLRHNGYGPRPGPISIMAEHTRIKDKQ